MNKDIAKKWCEALRGGEFKQASGMLSRIDANDLCVGYCCLGVLCEVFRRETQRGEWDSLGWFVLTKNEEEATAYPPISVQKWAEMNSHCGSYSDARSLAGDNDDGATFAQIADTIERHVDEL